MSDLTQGLGKILINTIPGVNIIDDILGNPLGKAIGKGFDKIGEELSGNKNKDKIGDGFEKSSETSEIVETVISDLAQGKKIDAGKIAGDAAKKVINSKLNNSEKEIANAVIDDLTQGKKVNTGDAVKTVIGKTNLSESQKNGANKVVDLLKASREKTKTDKKNNTENIQTETGKTTEPEKKAVENENKTPTQKNGQEGVKIDNKAKDEAIAKLKEHAKTKLGMTDEKANEWAARQEAFAKENYNGDYSKMFVSEDINKELTPDKSGNLTAEQKKKAAGYMAQGLVDNHKVNSPSLKWSESDMKEVSDMVLDDTSERTRERRNADTDKMFAEDIGKNLSDAQKMDILRQTAQKNGLTGENAEQWAKNQFANLNDKYNSTNGDFSKKFVSREAYEKFKPDSNGNLTDEQIANIKEEVKSGRINQFQINSPLNELNQETLDKINKSIEADTNASSKSGTVQENPPHRENPQVEKQQVPEANKKITHQTEAQQDGQVQVAPEDKNNKKTTPQKTAEEEKHSNNTENKNTERTDDNKPKLEEKEEKHVDAQKEEKTPPPKNKEVPEKDKGQIEQKNKDTGNIPNEERTFLKHDKDGKLYVPNQDKQ